MSIKRKEIPQSEIERQLYICAEVRQAFEGRQPLAFVDTFGCQQNEEDSEKVRGYLSEMGFAMTAD